LFANGLGSRTNSTILASYKLQFVYQQNFVGTLSNSYATTPSNSPYVSQVDSILVRSYTL